MITNIIESLSFDLLYYLDKKNHSSEEIKKILKLYPEIKFVSLVGVDLGGNDTDEKIPIEVFLEDLDKFLAEGIQTDGSSVVLPGIASLNNGKVDLIPDNDVKWFVDYNYDNVYLATNKPVGTLRIPCFLQHNGEFIDSRSILKRVVNNFKKEIIDLFNNKHLSNSIGLNKKDIEDVVLTVATELEFWVRTPEYNDIKINELSTSQVMQEQYWKRTKGTVRTALECSLSVLNKYGLNAEMGHKEVGGVKAKLTSDGTTTNIMEQLEIDWKYDEALQTADNELLARTFVKEIFQYHGLDVSFKAKPIEGVAGSGEHTHVGVALKLKNGKNVNLFNPKDRNNDFLSIPGWGAIMGILKNYEVINPFISATNDALERLKPGFEAPVSIVASIGKNISSPSRNRTVLLGLIRDLANPMATRFEVRSPNPHSNTYLTIATLYQGMLDGIKYAVVSLKTTKLLEDEFNKKQGEVSEYLEKNREYRSELDVFNEYTEEERSTLFGQPPKTVWENLKGLYIYPEKLKSLFQGDVFNNKIIHSYYLGVLKRWYTEINSKLLPQNAKLIKNFKNIHEKDLEQNSLDEENWQKIRYLKLELLKDSSTSLSIFSKLRQAINKKNYDNTSELQIEMHKKVKVIKDLYALYKRNIL